jgi:protocatechuate 3,4-dioxygenase beta subunit
MIKKALVLTSIFFSLASDAAVKKKTNLCTPSKPAINNYEPEKFPNTNNLLRNSGEQPLTCGTKIVIRGKLVDKNCVPISDAKISIWQKACDGKYPFKPMRNIYNKNLINLKSSSTFLGAGSTTTDNKGEFYFITTIPGTSKKEVPHINVKINHQYFDEFYTKLNLSRTDAEDPPVEFETPQYREDGVLVNEFRIVMTTKHPLREF